MLDVIHGGGQCSLRDINDPVIHVLRDEAVVIPDNADHWNVDIRKNIGWGTKDRKHPHDQDEDGHDHERIRPT